MTTRGIAAWEAPVVSVPLVPLVLLALFFVVWPTSARAFLPPRDTAGPLTVEIQAPDKVVELGTPFDATVSLTNSSSTPLTVQLEIWVIEGWQVRPKSLLVDGKPVRPKSNLRVERTVALAANGKESLPLRITAGPSTYNALYPLHARAIFADPVSNEKREAHAIKILTVEAPREKTAVDLILVKPGVTPLLRYGMPRVAIHAQGTGVRGIARQGSPDPETGAVFEISSADRAGRLACFSIHPPYRKGWGTIWAEYQLVLPDAKPIALTFSTAIRDNTEKEPPSDGVEFTVRAGSINENRRIEDSAALFNRFTKSKVWEPASVDLSQYAGKRIAVVLEAGPGPAHDTVCDSGYWGNPTIMVGTLPQTLSAPLREKQRQKALEIAQAALQGTASQWGWRIKSDTGTFGISFLPSPEGLAGAAIAVATPKQTLASDGFEVQIDGLPIASIPVAAAAGWKNTFENGRAVTEAVLSLSGGPTRVRCEVWAEGGALRCRFSLPEAKRDERGNPRFTLIGLGPAAQVKPERVYAGFGNVIEKPGKFSLGSNGFQLSTRHVGADYDNGLSLVQASDVFPDRLQVDPERGLVQLQVHHDATISLIPSEKGAFAAAKVYRDNIAGFKPAPGVARLRGRMCLDYWGMSYQRGIETVEKLVKYGVTDCVYVWHNWQRWGYDYRLPEIYPARGSHEEFLRLAEICRKHGILFAPHDNYIDIYPDAEGYSYNHIIFNEDGTPQKAWYNKGRDAQSYRWRPDAFQPWLERNVALLKRDVKPTGYFIDVFTAIEPMDFYDSTGRFHPKTETIRKWGECFDYVREQFGGAPQISEAGSDHLIGRLDAGEADHNSVVRDNAAQWGWRTPCADAERTPWHDAASHGSFVLFAGGLASRYVSGLDRRTHGYGSDDYLSLTVLGGRNPMAEGDSSAETILTYWMLHDVCRELGGRPMTGHEFGDNNIHRQIVRFGDDAVVSVNRGKEDWKVGDAVLPEYGFVAKAGEVRAEVTRRDGVVCGYAESGNTIFVDARPPRSSLLESNKDRKVIDFGAVSTNGVFRMTGGNTAWQITLLPGCPASEIRLKPSRLAGRPNARVTAIEKLGEDGKTLGAVEFKQLGEEAVFQTAPGDFGYRLALK